MIRRQLWVPTTVLCFAFAGPSVVASTIADALPTPFYTADVLSTVRVGAGSVSITTRDSVDAVCAWYRRYLQDRIGESVTSDGAHIFYTRSGATVDVEPGNRFAPDTTIGLSWDAKKFGDYRPAQRTRSTP